MCPSLLLKSVLDSVAWGREGTVNLVSASELPAEVTQLYCRGEAVGVPPLGHGWPSHLQAPG